MDWLNACKEFGILGGLLLIIMSSIVGLCFLGFKWILEQFKVELDGNRKERRDYLDTLSQIKSGIEEHNARSKEFMCSVGKEHNEMILALGRINGYKDH